MLNSFILQVFLLMFNFNFFFSDLYRQNVYILSDSLTYNVVLLILLSLNDRFLNSLSNWYSIFCYSLNFFPKTLYRCSPSLKSFSTIIFQFYCSAIINLNTLYFQKWIFTHCHNFKIFFIIVESLFLNKFDVALLLIDCSFSQLYTENFL